MTTLTDRTDLDRHGRRTPGDPRPDAGAAVPVRVAAPGSGEAAPAASVVDVRVKALTRFAISITVFNVVGHLLLGFEQSPITPITAVAVGYLTAIGFEWVDSWAHGRRPQFAGGPRALAVFLLPAHITALACAMLLYGNASLWPYVFAVVVANASKYVFRFRVRGSLRHFLNPSNFGIAATLFLFSWVGFVPPYHFTNAVSGPIDWLIPAIILVFGTMLNAKLTRKMPLIAAWVGGFAAQAVVRWVFFDDPLLGALMPMTGVAFVLFTNYMISDPGTTPVVPRHQVIFGLTAAFVYGGLVVSGVVFGLFYALVITCALRGLVMFVAERRAAATADSSPGVSAEAEPPDVPARV